MSTSLLSPYRTSLLVGGIAFLIAGCSGNEAAKVSPGAENDPKPAESIGRLNAPYERSLAYTLQLNSFRSQTFADAILADSGNSNPQLATKLQVVHANVPYTEAYRHSVFLNTSNSDTYNPNGATGKPVGAPSDTITSATPYADLREESSPGAKAIGIFPALFTNSTIYARIAAVVGSPEVLSGSSPNTVNQFFIFNGDIPLKSGTGNSELRGYNLNSRTNANSDIYKFTPVDNVWYSSRGRITMMRADLRYWAYASAFDGESIIPPWPILNHNFIGTVTTLRSTQNVQLFGFWPNNLNQDVCPYGLDTDMVDVVGVANARIPYSGPPIHITIPVREPFSINQTTSEDGVIMSFRKLGGDLADGISQPIPRREILKNMAFRVRQNGTFAQIFRNPDLVTGAPGPYDYTFVTSTPTFDEGDNMENGELIMVPTEPLEPNSWYEVGVRLHTASYVLPVGSTSTGELYTWRFKTNGKTPY